MSAALTILPPEEITAPWLSAALAQRGIDATVASFTMDVVGTGQLGETRRFNLNYRGTPPPNAPATVVGKFTSATEVARESGRTMGFYRAEVMFYRELAHRAKIRTPFVYVAEIDPVTHHFALIFEDLAPAQVGDQMRGCTLDEARAALREAALLHAAFWNDTELMNQPWVNVPPGAQGFYTTELVERSWEHVKRDYRDYLTIEVIAACDKLVRNHAYWNRPRDFPKCFSHNDFRPDNMLFGKPGDRVGVVDWQTSAFLGTGMDLAYFLGGIFPRDARRANEHMLLREYHEQLCGHGVNDYSFEHLMNDYRHYSFAQAIVAMTATLIVKRTERGDRMLMHMLVGSAQQAIDNDALALLPE